MLIVTRGRSTPRQPLPPPPLSMASAGGSSGAASPPAAPQSPVPPPPQQQQQQPLPPAPPLTAARREELRKTISELDAVLAIGVAAWLRKRGKVRCGDRVVWCGVALAPLWGGGRGRCDEHALQRQTRSAATRAPCAPHYPCAAARKGAAPEALARAEGAAARVLRAHGRGRLGRDRRRGDGRGVPAARLPAVAWGGRGNPRRGRPRRLGCAARQGGSGMGGREAGWCQGEDGREGRERGEAAAGGRLLA